MKMRIIKEESQYQPPRYSVQVRGLFGWKTLTTTAMGGYDIRRVNSYHRTYEEARAAMVAYQREKAYVRPKPVVIEETDK